MSFLKKYVCILIKEFCIWWYRANLSRNGTEQQIKLLSFWISCIKPLVFCMIALVAGIPSLTLYIAFLVKYVWWYLSRSAWMSIVHLVHWDWVQVLKDNQFWSWSCFCMILIYISKTDIYINRLQKPSKYTTIKEYMIHDTGPNTETSHQHLQWSAAHKYTYNM